MARRPGPADHVPSRPTWRCRACGVAWPCSTAKLNLLAKYRQRKAELKADLLAQQETAADDLAELDGGRRPAGLEDRFTAWVEPRG
ncbi:flavin reductase [Micromonospora sp. WMMD998]|uniref:flavin reductase n=1 Tax=Micromonospora sp. WMMD998 TaxID=3016092 RepID=UPI00249BCA8A|nr:flavin reductase [Micromonospora sp. WMMD998]WFE37709.1 flavin reductase [Micromonospora sp. WMMD998]